MEGSKVCCHPARGLDVAQMATGGAEGREEEPTPMDIDPTGPCCGICDPPTRFQEREKIRIANRPKAEIKAEIQLTLMKLSLFFLWFYASLYISCLVMALAMDVTFTASMPFEADKLDWDNDEGIVIGA